MRQRRTGYFWVHVLAAGLRFLWGILEIGHDFFQPSRDRCDSELLLEIRHRMDFYTEIGTNSKYYSRSTQIGSLQDLRPEIGAF